MKSYDVIVAGGGPAGSTAATLVAQAGHRVLLLERSTEPQFKIGESLMPATYWTFERLGVLDRMRASRFPAKYSVQFISAGGRASSPFYFSETDPHVSSQTWQVLRSDFDEMLLDNAREQGVEVVRGAAVQEVLFEGNGSARAVGVRAELPGEEVQDIAARVVVDATGQRGLIARRLGLKTVDPLLRNAAIFTHFEGAVRDSGRDEGATLIFHTAGRDSWFWFIPLPENRASVGVVGSLDYLIRGRNGDPQAIFEEELAQCPALAPRLAEACQAMPAQVAKDFTYRCRQVAGDGWVLAGDAFGFLDPIYSTGVFLALTSGEMAADAIVDALAADDVSAQRLGRFEQEFTAGMEALRRVVYAFYDRDFSFGEFLRRYPHLRREVIDVLMGNVFRRPVDALFEPLSTMVQVPEDLVTA